MFWLYSGIRMTTILFISRYKTKPSEDYEDPQDVLAIKNAKENMGDFKLKTAEDYTVPEHLRINAEQKRNELAMLENIVRISPVPNLLPYGGSSELVLGSLDPSSPM